MNSNLDQTNDNCMTCADTGHWQGEPEPCPECGAFVSHQKQQPKSLRYVEKHTGPNRHERRAIIAKERKYRP